MIPLTPDLVPAVTAINNAAYPAVPISSEADIAGLVGLSELSLAVWDTDAKRAIGFVIALGEGHAYDSENYRWFSARADRFVYVDRIVLAPEAQGRGIGPQLYAQVFNRAAERETPTVFCEVNVEPPNPGSLAFHTRLGFSTVGELSTKNDSVRVALLERVVSMETE